MLRLLLKPLVKYVHKNPRMTYMISLVQFSILTFIIGVWLNHDPSLVRKDATVSFTLFNRPKYDHVSFISKNRKLQAETHSGDDEKHSNDDEKSSEHDISNLSNSSELQIIQHHNVKLQVIDFKLGFFFQFFVIFYKCMHIAKCVPHRHEFYKMQAFFKNHQKLKKYS